MTVDEQLLAFREHCPFRHHMPSKPAKCGIKIWLLCDSKTKFAWNAQVYTGKTPGQPAEKNQGQRVVLDLVKYLKGRNITSDNFFTTHQLTVKPLAKKNTLVGTFRSNKTFLPQISAKECR